MNKNTLQSTAERILGAKERILHIGRSAVEKVSTSHFKEHAQAAIEDGARAIGVVAAGVAFAFSAEYTVAGVSEIAKDPGVIVQSIVPQMHVRNQESIVGPARHIAELCDNDQPAPRGESVCPSK